LGRGPGARHWASNQRSFKRKLDRGDPNLKITAAWAAKLDALG
jgi:hypothetical protein